MPEYTDLYKEYKRLAKNHRRVEWYSLYDGPRNIRELTEYLNRGFEYGLYQRWSKMSHVADANHLTFTLVEGKRVLGPIRNSLDMAGVVCSALGMLHYASMSMINEYRYGNDKSYIKWWQKEVGQTYAKLVKIDLKRLENYQKIFLQKEPAT